jgi:hypothetical protein
MADPYAQYQSPPVTTDPYAAYQSAPAGPGRGGATPAPDSHPLDAAPGLISSWWDQIHHGPANLYDVGKGIAGLVTGDTEKSMGAQTGSLYQKMKDAFNKGDYTGAAFHGLNYALSGIPGVSSVLDSAGEDFRNGDVAAGTGKTLGLLTNLGIGMKAPEIVDSAAAIPGKVAALPETAATAIRSRIQNVNNPTVEGALASVEKGTPPAPSVIPQGDPAIQPPVAPQGVRMTPYQRAGQAGTEKVAQNLRNMPGTSSEAEEFYQGQQDDIANEAKRRIAQQQSQGALPSYSGQPMQDTNDVGAGQFVQDEIRAATKKRQADANEAYNYVREKTAANVQPVQTGTSEPSSIVDENGKPYGGAPVYGLMETPIELAPVRAQLKSVYDDLSTSLTPSQQQYSPAFTKLKNLMESEDQQMPAMQFDKFLGALKSITRNGDSPNLSDPSQALARRVIGAGENSMNKALAGAGPDVNATLQRGRQAVKDYHDSDEFLQSLDGVSKDAAIPNEGAKTFDMLTKGGNRVYGTLQKLKGYSPAAVDTIGRTYLNEIMDKATREGGWGRSNGVKADWDRMGDSTKNLIYGPKVTNSLNQLFLAAKKLTPAEGSATAGRLSAFGGYGDIGTALAELVGGIAGGIAGGYPMAGTAAGVTGAAGTLLATRVRPAILARIAFRPDGANLLNQAIRLPVNSSAFVRTMKTLSAMALTEQGKDQPQ